MTGDLRIIRNNVLRKLFNKGPKYREVRATNLEKAKRCILDGLDNCISSWCYKNGVDKSFFLEWTNNFKVKIHERMSHLTNKLYTNKHRDCLSSPDVKNVLDNIHEDFILVPIDKSTGNTAVVCKICYASIITTELGLNNNSSTDTYNNAGGLSANNIIDKNIKDLKIKFVIDNIPIENHRLPNMYWMPKMHKNPIKAGFIIASPKSSIKPLVTTMISVGFFTGVNTFWVVQNNKPVIDAMNGLNKRKKATSVISLLSLRSSARLLIFLWGLIQLLFLPTYSYISMKVSG